MVYDLTLEFYLPVTPDKVMQLLTEPEKIKEWSGADAVVEKSDGGRFEMFDGWVSGKVLKATDNELAYTWKSSDWDDDVKPSEVYYKLIEENGSTKIELKHIGFPNQKEMDSHASGWTEHFFGPIETYILESSI